MSSVYGPALLKPAAFEENTEFSGGKTKANKENGNELETDVDRAKRIRKERKALKAKDKETTLKLNMGQAISAVLGQGGTTSAGFMSFGPAPPPVAGPAGPPAAGPAGPAAGPAGPPQGPPAGPSGPAPGPTVGAAVATPTVSRPAQGPAKGVAAGPAAADAAGASEASRSSSSTAQASGEASAADASSASGAAGPAPRPRGPARPPPEALPQAPAEPAAGEAAAPAQAEPLRPFDHLATQKRVSWDELKERLANQELRQEGVPGSKSFDAYSEKLEKTRNERLQKQETETKKLLKRAAGVSEKKMKKLRKEMKEKGPKRTADGAILANSDESSSEQEDALLARYKKGAS